MHNEGMDPSQMFECHKACSAMICEALDNKRPINMWSGQEGRSEKPPIDVLGYANERHGVAMGIWGHQDII